VAPPEATSHSFTTPNSGSLPNHALLQVPLPLTLRCSHDEPLP
jgi:hypothetical protein